MGLSLRLRRSVKRLLVKPRVNTVVRTTLASPLGVVLPEAKRTRIPVCGVIRIDLPNGRQLLMQSDGDDAIASKLFWSRGLTEYEPDSMRLFLALIARSHTFFDIGANTGIYALIAGTLDARRMVCAFEPMPAIFAYLQRNIDLNRCTNVSAVQAAVTDAEGSVPFYIPSGTAVFPFSASTAPGISKQRTERIQVDAITIDAFVARRGIERVDLMKIDTETTEPAVLRGAHNTLQRHRPLLICEVLPFDGESRLHTALDGLDYRYYWITDRGLEPRTQIQGDPTLHNMNYLFAPAERVGEIDPTLFVA